MPSMTWNLEEGFLAKSCSRWFFICMACPVPCFGPGPSPALYNIYLVPFFITADRSITVLRGNRSTFTPCAYLDFFSFRKNYQKNSTYYNTTDFSQWFFNKWLRVLVGLLDFFFVYGLISGLENNANYPRKETTSTRERNYKKTLELLSTHIKNVWT